jgi:hypothetical protein
MHPHADEDVDPFGPPGPTPAAPAVPAVPGPRAYDPTRNWDGTPASDLPSRTIAAWKTRAADLGISPGDPG